MHTAFFFYSEYNIDCFNTVFSEEAREEEIKIIPATSAKNCDPFIDDEKKN